MDRFCAEEKLPSEPIERTVLLVYRYFTEEQGGSLSQFFYNTDASWIYASETVNALVAIGAQDAARVLGLAAESVCKDEYAEYTGTWSGYLSTVDPESKRDPHFNSISAYSEQVESHLNAFILAHRDILEVVI